MHAGSIALVAGAVAAGGVIVAGIFAWRAWRRVSRTRDAASALLAIHQDRLDASIVTAGSHVARLGEHGDELAASITQLRDGTAHLGWMLRRVPDGRDQLRHELLQLLLPTSVTEGGDDDA